MTCVHGDGVIGVSGDIDMFLVSTFSSASWLGILYVCALGVQEGGVTSASSSVSGGEISCFMVANGWSSQCLVQ